MSQPHHLRRPFAALLIVLLLVQVTGCMQWRTVESPSPESLAKDDPSAYRLTLHDGRVLLVDQLVLRNDSLVTTRHRLDGEAAVFEREAVALDSVQRVEARVPNGTATAVGIGVGVLLVVGLVAVATEDIGPSGSLFGGDSGNLSCPLVYSWTGRDYRLDSGTFGGAVMPALTRTDLDNLEFLVPDRGVLRFLMTAEQPETEYVDAFSVVAIDHPVGTMVIPDGRANDQYYAISAMHEAIEVRDHDGRDVAAVLRDSDGRAWSTAMVDRDPADPDDRRDGIIATFARPASDTAVLVVDGRNTNWSAFLLGELVRRHGRTTAAWYDPGSGPPAAAAMRAAQERHGALAISVWREGRWQAAGAFWEAGPEVRKRQAVAIPIADLTGDVIKIRLESAPAFWNIDQVAIATPSNRPVTARHLTVDRAIDDHGTDRRPDLAAADHQYLVMERGDSIRIEVRDPQPVPPTGTERSYLLRTNGWYRVHGRDQAEPDLALLARLAAPDGMATVSVEWFNSALAALRTGVGGHD